MPANAVNDLQASKPGGKPAVERIYALVRKITGQSDGTGSSRAKRQWLLAILVLALIIRLAFLAEGATIFHGPGQEHLNGDSFSFTQSFLNFWHTGHYTLEPLIPDASFGRLPGYPFFYGLHYLLFGAERVLVALSITQVLLDTVTCGLLYGLLLRWTGRVWPARLVGLLYATYPFAIVWVTIVGSETLNTFTTVVWLTVLTWPGRRWSHYVLIGTLTAAVLYVRVYMGLLLPVAALFVWAQPANGVGDLRRWQRTALVCVGFGMLYVWWPLRNYLNHDRVVLVKPASAGYPNQQADMQAYLDWLHTWTNDNTTWVEGLVLNKPLRYPSRIFSSRAEELRAYALTALAARCGSSFHLRRLDTHDYSLVKPDRYCSCNADIAAGFDSLRRGYMERHPVRYWLDVPTANLRKVFFKSSTVHQAGTPLLGLVQRLLFAYRTVGLLLGMLGLLVGWQRSYFWPIMLFVPALYMYISFFFRSLEMRYLLQADVLLLLPAAWALLWLARRFHLVRDEPQSASVTQV